MKYTKEEFAKLLSGRKRGQEITDEERKIAKENGLLVVFAESDDLIEMRGIITDEAYAYGGGFAHLVLKTHGIDLIQTDQLEQITELLVDNDLNYRVRTVVIEAICDSENDAAFVMTTKLPHAQFNIFDDEDASELYCIGIVVEKDAIINALI